MKKPALLLVTLLIASPFAQLGAQTGIRPPQGWSLGFMGGAAAFSDMQRGSVRVFRPTALGMESRELPRRVGAETSTALAGHVSYWPSRNWGMRVHATWVPTRFETVMRESEAEFSGLPSSSEDQQLAGLDIVTADLQAMFRLPTIKNRVLPYGIIGGGLARYAVRGGEEPVPEEAAGEFEGGVKVRPAAVVGVGAMLPFRNRAFRLHFELTNHIAGTPIQGGQGQLVDTGDGTIQFDPQSEPPGESRVSVTSGVRFMVGVSWSPNQ